MNLLLVEAAQAKSTSSQPLTIMKTKIDLTTLRQKCPLPTLMHSVGLGEFAKPTCSSPFSQDKADSWGIFQYQGRWMYKDGSTGELGDEIGLLARMNNLDAQKNFRALHTIYHEIATGKCRSKVTVRRCRLTLRGEGVAGWQGETTIITIPHATTPPHRQRES